MRKYSIAQNSSTPFKNRILFEKPGLLLESPREILKKHPDLLSRPYLDQLAVILKYIKNPPPEPGKKRSPTPGHCFLCDNQSIAFYLFGYYIGGCPSWDSMEYYFNSVTQTANYCPPVVCAACEKSKCTVGMYLEFFGAVFLLDTKIPLDTASQFILFDKKSKRSSSSISKSSIADVEEELPQTPELQPPSQPPKLYIMQIEGRYWVLLYQLKRVFGIGWIRTMTERFVEENCPSSRKATPEEVRTFLRETPDEGKKAKKLIVLLEEILIYCNSMTMSQHLEPYAKQTNAKNDAILTFNDWGIESETIKPPSQLNASLNANSEQFKQFQDFWSLPDVPYRNSAPLSFETKNKYVELAAEYLAFYKAQSGVTRPTLSDYFDTEKFAVYIYNLETERKIKGNALVPYFNTAIAVSKFLLAVQLKGKWEESPLITDLINKRNKAMSPKTNGPFSSAKSGSSNGGPMDIPTVNINQKKSIPASVLRDDVEDDDSFVDGKLESGDSDYNGEDDDGEDDDGESLAGEEKDSSSGESLSCEIITPTSPKELRKKKRTVNAVNNAKPPPEPKRQKAATLVVEPDSLAVFRAISEFQKSTNFYTKKTERTLYVYVNGKRMMFDVPEEIKAREQTSFIAKIDKTNPNGKHIDVLLAHLLFHAPAEDRLKDWLNFKGERGNTRKLVSVLIRACERPNSPACKEIVTDFLELSHGRFNEHKNLENIFSSLIVSVVSDIVAGGHFSDKDPVKTVFKNAWGVRKHGRKHMAQAELIKICPTLVEDLLYLPITVFESTAKACMAYISCTEHKHKSEILTGIMEEYERNPPNLKAFFVEILKSQEKDKTE